MYIDINTLSNQSTYAPGLLLLTSEQEQLYIKYSGFIKIISTDPVQIEPDTEAWETWKSKQPDKINLIKEQKIKELSNICENTIFNGTEVTLNEDKKENFTYNLVDQANITEMFNAVLLGATEYPYHANNDDCRMYTAQDIITIYSTLSSYKTAQTTYYNQLKRYIKSLEQEEEIKSVEYGQELTGEYLDTYNTLIEQASKQLEVVLSKATALNN